MSSKRKPLVLCILDGWGWAPDSESNAITQALTPHWDRLIQNEPYTLLEASGISVGLPKTQMGNSEVGHMTIGCGRPLLQDLPRISQALETDSVAKNPAFQNFINTLKETGGTAHLMGLLSPGGVHSHQDHILGMSTLIAHEGIPVALHFFLDGRDTPPRSAQDFIESFFSDLQKTCSQSNLVTLATLGGRYFAMDRDNNWDRVSQAYDCIVSGQQATSLSWKDLIQEHYHKGIEDEFIPPHSLAGYQGVQAGDGLFMTNFRADRARQLLRALLHPDFTSFNRTKRPCFSSSLGMTSYADDLTPLLTPLFPPEEPSPCLGLLLSQAGLTQLRTAETEKYAHVTFFLNGGREDPFPGEERALVASPSVATYDLCPEMSASEVTTHVEESLGKKAHDVIIMNLANTDMVGHTGNFEASRQAVEAVDQCLGRLQKAVLKAGGTLFVTADHGNVEQMINPATGRPHTAHTTNLVPFVVVTQSVSAPLALQKSGTLADIAPTLLAWLDQPIPAEMSGQNLITQGQEAIIRYGVTN